MKKVIKTGSRLFMKIGAGSALFGATIASSVAQAQTAETEETVPQPRDGGVVEMLENIVGEFGAAFGIVESAAVIGGALLIIAAIINMGLRAKKGKRAEDDTLWWPVALLVGVLLMEMGGFRDAVSTTVLNNDAPPVLDGNFTNP